MGVFNKLKSIFYDEVVVDDEDDELEEVNKIVKKETKKDESPRVEELKFKTVEIDPIKEEVKPKVKEEKKEEPLSERNLFKNESSFNFVNWDNDEEEKPHRKNVLEEQSRTQRSVEVREESPRVFKPTPIISPIWGVLDKDYKKDEIKERTVDESTYKTSATTYDSVRRKAYGTLKDDLEDTLNSMSKVSIKEINVQYNKPQEEEILSRTSKIEDLIDKIDEAEEELDKNMSIEEAENNVELNNFEDEDDERDLTDKTLTDSTLEHDLFNLIDSMYDKED